MAPIFPYSMGKGIAAVASTFVCRVEKISLVFFCLFVFHVGKGVPIVFVVGNGCIGCSL